VLQHFGQVFELLALVTKQGHHTLIGLLPRQTVFRVERDGAAALVVQVDQLAERGILGHLTHLGAGGAQTEVGLHLGYSHLDRAVAKDLQDQGTVELDIALHQHAGRRHFAQQLAHRRRVGTGTGVGGATGQDVLPGVGQADQHAAHGHALENEFVQFRQGSGHPVKGAFLS